MNTDFQNVQDSITPSIIQYADTLKSEAAKIIHGCTSWLHYSLRGGKGGHHGEWKELLRKKAPKSLPGQACVGWFLGALRRQAEKAMAPHSSTLAWKIPWTEEPGGLQSMGSQRVAQD